MTINFGFGPHWLPLLDLDDIELDDEQLCIINAVAGSPYNDNDNDLDVINDEQLRMIVPVPGFPRGNSNLVGGKGSVQKPQ